MSHVFISYKKEDRPRVKRLVDALTGAGFSVWWDVHIGAGADWRSELQARLDAAACVVVVWTRLSVSPEGAFVQEEAAQADRRGIYVPVALDPVAPPLGFGQKQVIRLTGWRGAQGDPRFVELVQSIESTMAKSGGARPPPAAASPVAARPWARAALALALAVFLALIAAVVFDGRRLCAAAGLACPAWLSPADAPADSIAVLPFANLSGDPGQTYFSDGLSEELLGRLVRMPRLRVAARTSSFKFRGGTADTRTIAATLGVAYILDGSVRRDGGRVRVSAHLIEARTGFETWSQTYDRDFKDILTVQSGIAEAVAGALSIRLGGAGRAALNPGGATSPQAYDDYLRARALFNASGGEASDRDALAKAEAAIAADRGFAAALVLRARLLTKLANQTAPTDGQRALYDQAVASARRAVEIAPSLADGEAALADALVYGARDFGAARQAYGRALAAGGAGDAEVLLRYGPFECELGATAACLGALRHAVALDPLNARAFRALGRGLIFAGQYSQAIVALERALALNPGITTARAGIGEALLLLGKPAEAMRQYALEPIGWQRQTGQAIALWRLGDQAGARAQLAALTAAGGDAGSYQAAQVRAQWGDRDGAFAALETSLRVGDPGVEQLKVDPLMAPLRRDRRFAAMLARAGLAG